MLAENLRQWAHFAAAPQFLAAAHALPREEAYLRRQPHAMRAAVVVVERERAWRGSAAAPVLAADLAATVSGSEHPRRGHVLAVRWDRDRASDPVRLPNKEVHGDDPPMLCVGPPREGLTVCELLTATPAT